MVWTLPVPDLPAKTGCKISKIQNQIRNVWKFCIPVFISWPLRYYYTLSILGELKIKFKKKIYIMMSIYSMLFLIVNMQRVHLFISGTLPFYNHIWTHRSAFILARFRVGTLHFSSPELKHILSFSNHILSGVRLSVCIHFMFSTTSLKPLCH